MSKPQTPDAKRVIDALFDTTERTLGPSESYWVNATREELHARIAARQPAMQASKFGRMPAPYLAETQ